MSINPYQSPTTLDDRTGDEPRAARPDGVHEYLLSASNANGKKVTERVEATSADAAVKTLEARGYTGIVLHTDDFGALFTTQSKCESALTPRDYVGLRHLRGYWGHVGFLTRKLYTQLWKVNVDTPGARQLLVRARSHALSDVMIPVADAVEGVLLFEEGNPTEA